VIQTAEITVLLTVHIKYDSKINVYMPSHNHYSHTGKYAENFHNFTFTPSLFGRQNQGRYDTVPYAVRMGKKKNDTIHRS